VCEVIGNIGECNDMYIEGCAWDSDREMCTLNPMTDNDGNQARSAEGCMKCDDIQHRHTCNSLSNCFWTKKKGQVKDQAKGVCKSCSKLDDEGTCNASDGQCQWRTNKTRYTGTLERDASGLIKQGESYIPGNEESGGDPFRCYPARLYPVIYEWIWYNITYLISLFVCILILWKFPTPPFPMSIGANIFKFIIAVVTIPALSILINRADGLDGRKLYIDPPFDVKNPGVSDFIYDQNKKGAKWPAVFYDDDWDHMVTDHKILRDFVDFKVGPWILDWTKPLWGLLSKWNDLVNTLGDNEVAVILSFFIILLGCIYSIGVLRIIKLRGELTNIITSEWTVRILIGGVLIALYGNHLMQKRKIHLKTKTYKNIDGTHDVPGYPGLQTKRPDQSTLWGTIIKALSTKSENTVCPYGCFKFDDGTPCADTRSMLAFRGSWDPNPKKSPHSVPYKGNKNLWKIIQGQYICPPPDNHTKYPYDQLCTNTGEQCLSSGTEDKPYFKEADAKCGEYYKKYLTCDTFTNTNDKEKKKDLTVTYSNKEWYGAKPTEIKLNCAMSIPTNVKDYCPFKLSIAKLDEVDDYHARQPVNAWQNIYDRIAGSTEDPKRRLSRQEKINWQNQFRYHVVDQNYSHDPTKG